MKMKFVTRCGGSKIIDVANGRPIPKEYYITFKDRNPSMSEDLELLPQETTKIRKFILVGLLPCEEYDYVYEEV